MLCELGLATGEESGAGLVGERRARGALWGGAGGVMAAIGVHLGATCACAAVYKVTGRGAAPLAVSGAGRDGTGRVGGVAAARGCCRGAGVRRGHLRSLVALRGHAASEAQAGRGGR